MSKNQQVPMCRYCGASQGQEFPLWPKSNQKFGEICVPCDYDLAAGRVPGRQEAVA